MVGGGEGDYEAAAVAGVGAVVAVEMMRRLDGGDFGTAPAEPVVAAVEGGGADVADSANQIGEGGEVCGVHDVGWGLVVGLWWGN